MDSNKICFDLHFWPRNMIRGHCTSFTHKHKYDLDRAKKIWFKQGFFTKVYDLDVLRRITAHHLPKGTLWIKGTVHEEWAILGHYLGQLADRWTDQSLCNTILTTASSSTLASFMFFLTHITNCSHYSRLSIASKFLIIK